MKMRPSNKSGERGVLSVMFALMVLVIVGFTGLAIDVGYLQWQKGRIQAAADAAAMGALRELELSHTDLLAAGQYDAKLNGFDDGHDGTTVAIHNPPSSGTYSNNSHAVEAVVTRTIPTFFMRAFGQTSVSVSARAVALTTSTQGSVGGCIFALDPAANNAFEISGSSVVTTSCGVVVNSASSKAFVNSGGGQLNLGSGAKIGVVGPGAGSGWVISGGSTVTDARTNQPELPVNIQHFTDPLSNLTAPTTPVTGGVQHDDSGSTWNIDSGHMPANNELNPGVYCGGLSIQSTNGTLTFKAGTYILAGGGLTINASQSTVVGTGVMFYNTRTSTTQTWGCSKNNLNAAKISINGGLGGSVTMSAPTTSGSESGVLFFEDRELPQTLSNAVTGGSYVTLNGALYFRDSQLTFSGGSSASNGYLVLVANIITISGTSNLGNDHTSLGGNIFGIAPATTGGGLVQ
jgi:Putative Flp pilus-assembly TadE/G-like